MHFSYPLKHRLPWCTWCYKRCIFVCCTTSECASVHNDTTINKPHDWPACEAFHLKHVWPSSVYGSLDISVWPGVLGVQWVHCCVSLLVHLKVTYDLSSWSTLWICNDCVMMVLPTWFLQKSMPQGFRHCANCTEDYYIMIIRPVMNS